SSRHNWRRLRDSWRATPTGTTNGHGIRITGMATEGARTTGEYITHHLQNLQVCKADGEWVWNHCAGNPMTVNVDSMFFSVLLGAVFVWLFGSVAKKVSSGRPGKLQAVVEILVEWV